MKVSVLILSYNEIDNLGACLDSLKWCSNVVLVDSGSTDGTVDVARERGVEILHRPFDNFAAQRNFGLDHGHYMNEWVLHLDCDEVLTDTFIKKLDALVEQDSIDAYLVPCKMILFGKWLRRSGTYPVYQVRLGHRKRLRFKPVGHTQREDLPAARIGVFDEPYLHYSFSKGMRSWLEKHIHYARDDAELLLSLRAENNFQIANLFSLQRTERRRALKAISAWLPFALRPAARFLYVYFFRLGLLDGRAGLAYAVMSSLYEAMIATFVFERTLGGPKDRLD